MHRSLILFLLSAVACQMDAEPRGPTPTTLAIIQTEPVTTAVSPPPLASVFTPVGTSVESDGIEVAQGVATVAEDLPRSVTVEVRAGENLVLLARWADSSVETVAELNGLDVSEPLYPGQSLVLPSVDETSDAAVLDSRQAFAQGRLERYLERRGGLMAVEEHRVRTGETAWAIARDQHGIPTWVLEAYNPDTDLGRLGIGERLLVPVLSDTVAEVDPVGETVEPEASALWGAPPVDPSGESTLGMEDELAPEDLPSASETVMLRAVVDPFALDPMDEEPVDAP